MLNERLSDFGARNFTYPGSKGVSIKTVSLFKMWVGVTFGFSHHLNLLDGSDSCWRLIYHFGPVFENLGDGVSTIYNYHQLLVEDTEKDEDG